MRIDIEDLEYRILVAGKGADVLLYKLLRSGVVDGLHYGKILATVTAVAGGL
jgi:hypothetical protein